MVYQSQTDKKIKKTTFLIFTLLLASISLSADQVITSKVVWKDRVAVNELITVKPPGSLEINPGTVVTFTGSGRINYISYGFTAKNVTFKADKPLMKLPRILIRSGLNDSIIFENCRFLNLVCLKTPAAVRTIFPKVEMINCRIENCSPVNFNHDMRSNINNNIFINPQGRGLTVVNSKYSRIRNNIFVAGKQSSILLLIQVSSLFCVISGNRFIDAPKTAMFIHGKSNGNQIQNNSFFDCSTGMYFTGKELRNIYIRGNLFWKNKNGIFFLNSGVRNQVINCVMWKCKVGLNMTTKKGDLSVKNSVFFECANAVLLRNDAIKPIFTSNCFSKNNKDFLPVFNAKKIPKNNLFINPLFVNPEQGNFRLQEKSFGYPANSPLLKSGTPEGVNIGLFP